MVPRSLLESRDWIVALHANPDGDTIGSALGMREILSQLGRKSVLVCADPIPPHYAFLKGAEQIQQEPPSETGWGLICVDCSDMDRLGETKSALEGLRPRINIDHHVSNRLYGDVNFVEPAAATGELVAKLFESLSLDLVPAAEALYIAISTDTGSFRYSNTTSDTHRIAARLLDCGVDPGRINTYTADSMPLSTLRLQTMALSRIEVRGEAAYTMITRKMLEECGAQDYETDGIVERIRALKGIEVAFLLRETPRGLVKASFRSKGKVDVNRLASSFGGGGHLRAAGATFDCPIEVAAQRILDVIQGLHDLR